MSPSRLARLAFAPFVLLVLACASVPGDFEPPDVHVVNIVPLEGNLFEQRIRVDLRLRNPNNLALSFDGIRFDLELNGNHLLRGLSDESVTIPRLGETVIGVTGTTTFLDLVRQFAALSSGEAAGFDYRLDGRVFLTSPREMGLDFERSGRLDR